MIDTIALCLAAAVLGGFGGIALCRKYGCRLPSSKKPAKKAKGR